MSVKGCDRNGCENIMCSKYSDNYGYICYECFEELLTSFNFVSIATFMASKKNKYGDCSETFLSDVFEES